MTTSSSFVSPSEPPGTAFAATAATALAAPSAAAPSASTGRSRFVASDWSPRVLVVDDDDICRIAAQRLLEQLGFAVDVARDGQEALNLSAGWPYVAIFMDCAMPNVDGYQAARKIRYQDRDGTGALVIAVTTHGRQICLAAGMDHHIPKPLRLDLLAAECTKLGLLPRTDRQPSPPAPAPAIDTPLLMAPLGATAGRSAVPAGTGAETFVSRASMHLPALWRAANARDIGSLGRIALQLKEAAASAGAARVADLCDQMVTAANHGKNEVATSLEPRLRQALAETADAIDFRLKNPESSDAPATAPTNGDAARTAPGEHPTLRIAMADDDPLARRIIAGMIERSDGLQLVGAASSVEKIVDVAVTKRPDTVLLDWMMPGGGGPEAARQIVERCPGTRVIALTASASPDTYLEMLKAGASGLLVKGCSGEALAQMIRRTAERPA